MVPRLRQIKHLLVKYIYILVEVLSELQLEISYSKLIQLHWGMRAKYSDQRCCAFHYNVGLSEKICPFQKLKKALPRPHAARMLVFLFCVG
jgi:hypothetical protein